ncbi:MAG: hypothetical protein HRU30_03905 [Rhodobacteraceae bacterium]|nr:hypothetical protein [Paracoccaceae bacterium]
MRFFWSFLLVLSVSSAAAETYQCNAHGAVVTKPDGTVLYLGKSCDAAVQSGGTGFWFNAASFLAVFIGPDLGTAKAYQVQSEIPCLEFCQAPD